jgi:hypothetical protein
MKIRHRDDYLPEVRATSLQSFTDKLLNYVTNRVLASRWLFLIALTVPLITLLPGMDTEQKILIIVSGNWVQFWALPALQRSQNIIQLNQDAKAEVDHHNLVRMAELLQKLAGDDVKPLELVG